MLQTKIITDWSNTYICESEIWTSENENKWRIIKIDNDWNVLYPKWNVQIWTWEWVNKPTDLFMFKPSDYSTLNFSYN